MNDRESKLQQEILSDAQRKADRALNRARSDMDKALAAVREQHTRLREQQLQEAQREADEKSRAITARVRHEIQRHWLTLREQGFEQLFSDLLEALERGDGIDPTRSLRQLLQEALEAIGPRDAVVRLNSAGAAILTEPVVADLVASLPPRTRGAAALQRQVDDSLRAGVVVESCDRQRRFDNTYATRLQRLRGELRALVSEGVASTESDDEAHA